MDEVDAFIAHAAYNAEERHQRYLRDRQLKGRPTRSFPKAGIGSRIVDMQAPGSTLHDSGALIRSRTLAAQAASNARQISQIKGRLATLKAHLAELLAKQKAANTTTTSKTSSTSTKTDTTKSNTPSKPKTAAQKAASKQAIKKAQEARAKNQKATPDQKPLSLDEQITKTRAVIADVEGQLRVVEERARTQTAS